MNKKVIIPIVIVVLVMCLCSCAGLVWYIGSQDTVSESDEEISEIDVKETILKDEECDHTTDDYLAYHGVEKLVVSINPCKTIWLLAEIEEEYTLTDPNGRSIYVTVWRDFTDNVTAGNTFTIRALDVPDTTGSRENAKLSIIRWVGVNTDLEKAKAEVARAVSEL